MHDQNRTRAKELLYKKFLECAHQVKTGGGDIHYSLSETSETAALILMGLVATSNSERVDWLLNPHDPSHVLYIRWTWRRKDKGHVYQATGGLAIEVWRNGERQSIRYLHPGFTLDQFTHGVKAYLSIQHKEQLL